MKIHSALEAGGALLKRRPLRAGIGPRLNPSGESRTEQSVLLAAYALPFRSELLVLFQFVLLHDVLLKNGLRTHELTRSPGHPRSGGRFPKLRQPESFTLLPHVTVA